MVNILTMTDEELTCLVKNDKDNEALKELIHRHSGIFVHVCRRFTCASNANYFQEDLFEDKNYVIYNAANTYDKDRGSKFSTWLANQSRYHCLNTLQKENKQLHWEEDSASMFFDAKSKDLEAEEKVKKQKEDTLTEIKSFLDDVKSDNIKKVIMEKYFSGEASNITFTEIAKINARSANKNP